MPLPSTSQARVLIAGREDALALFHEVLAGAGMNIVADCTTREQVVASLAHTRPDICVVDRELDGGGLVATAAIASPRRAPRVLLVGGRGSAAELRAAQLAGAADSLPGDVDAPGLVAAVAALAEGTQR
jgi:DNA-binding NarL/FixJ family response regulator